MSAEQEQRLLATLMHIDQMMGESLAILRGEDGACLTRYRHDLSPEQGKSLERDLRHLRETMAQVLLESGIRLPEPTCGVSRAVHARILLAVIALDEFNILPPQPSR